MKNILIISSLLILALFASLQGCSTLKSVKGAEDLVESSGKKPKMVSNNIWFEEKKDIRFFMGFSDQVHDQDVALREAELDGKKRIIEAIGTDIRVEGTRGLSGPDKEAVGRFFEESIAYLTDNTRLSGAILQETYWEKWARNDKVQISYYYKAYGIVRISNKDYEKTEALAADALIERAVQERNQAAEKAARGVKQRLLEGSVR